MPRTNFPERATSEPYACCLAPLGANVKDWAEPNIIPVASIKYSNEASADVAGSEEGRRGSEIPILKEDGKIRACPREKSFASGKTPQKVRGCRMRACSHRGIHFPFVRTPALFTRTSVFQKGAARTRTFAYSRKNRSATNCRRQGHPPNSNVKIFHNSYSFLRAGLQVFFQTCTGMRRNVYRNELNPVQDLSQSCTGLWPILYTFFAFAKLLIIRQLTRAENDAEEFPFRFLAPTYFLTEEKMSKFFTTFSLLAGSFWNTDVRMKRAGVLTKVTGIPHG